jgi:hypothetical protein
MMKYHLRLVHPYSVPPLRVTDSIQIATTSSRINYMLFALLMLCYKSNPFRRPIVSEPLVSFHRLSTGATWFYLEDLECYAGIPKIRPTIAWNRVPLTSRTKQRKRIFVLSPKRTCMRWIRPHLRVHNLLTCVSNLCPRSGKIHLSQRWRTFHAEDGMILHWRSKRLWGLVESQLAYRDGTEMKNLN